MWEKTCHLWSRRLYFRNAGAMTLARLIYLYKLPTITHIWCMSSDANR